MERESERVWRADWHTLTQLAHPAFEVVVDIVANGRTVVRLVEKPHDVIPSLEKGLKARGCVCVCARAHARVCVCACVCVCVRVVETAL